MTALRIAIWVVALLPAIAARGQQAAPGAPQRMDLDLAAYAASLEQWQAGAAALEAHPESAGGLRQSLPESVSVQVSPERLEERVEVSTGWLRSSVEDFEKAPAKRKQISSDIQQRLALMREEARALEAAAAPLPEARGKLNEILSRREFRGVRPPNWADRTGQQIVMWLARLLDKLFGGIRGARGAGEVLVWVVIGLALSLLVLWLKRALESAARSEAPVRPEAAVAYRRGSTQWLREALAAAARGDYREAMHCAYWAGIHRVEEAGVVKPDHARTPREHLRRLPQTYAQRPLVADLTRRFEVTWYGYQAATAADFEQARAQLEQLGCLSPSKPATEKS
jgi:hypothetical protein